ncbi:MAG: B12-binding domain-containing radical SAM protein [Treponema sp.]|nr:B12-binding domain-containing radical SAM protein [Treponema sp.]
MKKDIILTTINAKWIHPSLSLRLLKANLGSLEDRSEIIEFTLRQRLDEKVQPLLAVKPRILGISVSIWNHTQTTELLEELRKAWMVKPIIILGGPEVSYLYSDAKIFQFADYVIRGEGETAFRLLCEDLLCNKNNFPHPIPKEIISGEQVDPGKIKTAYHLYTDEDIFKKLIYVESSRGCPFKCEFCSSSNDNSVREFPVDKFLSEMEILIKRGVKTFKFLDRSFNINIKRSIQILRFFLDKINDPCASPLLRGEKFGINNSSLYNPPFVVHFEMVPSVFPPELREILARFPVRSLRLEIGIQSLNREVSARIGRACDPEKELEALRFLREKTNAIIHADLIAGLPGEDLASFGRGFDLLLSAVSGNAMQEEDNHRLEIQIGILKLLPGAPVARHNDAFAMRYNQMPPYEVIETSSISANDISRIKNFARFWEIIINRRLVTLPEKKPVFDRFMKLSDSLFTHFGRNWGIEKKPLFDKINEITDGNINNFFS